MFAYCPYLLIQPVWTFAFLILFLVYWVTVAGFLGTSGIGFSSTGASFDFLWVVVSVVSQELSVIMCVVFSGLLCFSFVACSLLLRLVFVSRYVRVCARACQRELGSLLKTVLIPIQERRPTMGTPLMLRSMTAYC